MGSHMDIKSHGYASSRMYTLWWFTLECSQLLHNMQFLWEMLLQNNEILGRLNNRWKLTNSLNHRVDIEGYTSSTHSMTFPCHSIQSESSEVLCARFGILRPVEARTRSNTSLFQTMDEVNLAPFFIFAR